MNPNKELVEKFSVIVGIENTGAATACATIAEEYARDKEERIKQLEDVLRELLKWCEPDGKYNYTVTIEKANHILNN